MLLCFAGDTNIHVPVEVGAGVGAGDRLGLVPVAGWPTGLSGDFDAATRLPNRGIAGAVDAAIPNPWADKDAGPESKATPRFSYHSIEIR